MSKVMFYADLEQLRQEVKKETKEYKRRFYRVPGWYYDEMSDKALHDILTDNVFTPGQIVSMQANQVGRRVNEVLRPQRLITRERLTGGIVAERISYTWVYINEDKTP